MSVELENRVLADAIRWFEEDESHYTPDVYLEKEHGCESDGPGREVVAACAIGGIEQALWRVTGRAIDVDKNERELAYAGTERFPGGIKRPSEDALGVYWGVMVRLNVETRRRAKAGEYDEHFEHYSETGDAVEAHEAAVSEVLDVEDVTQIGSTDESRELMLDVFRAALVSFDPAEVPA